MAENDDDYDILDEEDETNGERYLTFSVAEQTYGINIDCVQEIVGIQKVTAVPNLPSCVKGVINLRGMVIAVTDMRLRFHLPERSYSDRTCIIVVQAKDECSGLIVDGVRDVKLIPSENISPSLHLCGQQDHGEVQGLGRVDEEVVILLNTANVFALDQSLAAADVA